MKWQDINKTIMWSLRSLLSVSVAQAGTPNALPASVWCQTVQLGWLRLMPRTVWITPTPKAAWVTEIKCIYAHCCATSAFWNNCDSDSCFPRKSFFSVCMHVCVCMQPWQMCVRVGPVGPESDMRRGSQGLLWWDVMMAWCQLCEMVQGAVRTAAGALSHWSPREGEGWRGASGWEIARRGTLRRGAECLQNAPLWRRTGDVHRLYKNTSRGNTDGCMKHCIL